MTLLEEGQPFTALLQGVLCSSLQNLKLGLESAPSMCVKSVASVGVRRGIFVHHHHRHFCKHVCNVDSVRVRVANEVGRRVGGRSAQFQEL